MSQRSKSPDQRMQSKRERNQEHEQKIRWERDRQDANRIVVTDAVTGVVIAIVRSLFDIGRK